MGQPNKGPLYSSRPMLPATVTELRRTTSERALRLRALSLKGLGYAAEPAESGSCAADWSAGGEALAATGLAGPNRLETTACLQRCLVVIAAYLPVSGTPVWVRPPKRTRRGSPREDLLPERVRRGEQYAFLSGIQETGWVMGAASPPTAEQMPRPVILRMVPKQQPGSTLMASNEN